MVRHNRPALATLPACLLLPPTDVLLPPTYVLLPPAVYATATAPLTCTLLPPACVSKPCLRPAQPRPTRVESQQWAAPHVYDIKSFNSVAGEGGGH